MVLRYSLFLLTGAYSSLMVARLPSSAWIVSILAAASVCHVRSPLRFAGALLLGLSLQWWIAATVVADRLNPELAGQEIEIRVVVLDFPVRRGNTTTLVARTIDDATLPRRVRLSWYDAPLPPGIGESWSFRVRLRRPRGFANPGGFDYEGWLFRQGIGATGYVVAGERVNADLLRPSTRLRRYAVQRILDLLPDDDASAVMLAIGVGARHRITRQQWDRYAATGTSHLMAISGLHVGLAAGAAFMLFWASAAVFVRNAGIRDIAMWLALGVALLYAEMSGLAVPAKRAAFMAAITVAAFSLRRRINPGDVIATVCILLAVADPLSIHTPGFQLSFTAVALLLWLNRAYFKPASPSRIPGLTVLWSAVQRLSVLQLVLLLGLFPLIAVTFGRVALLAPLVNLLVLPVFNFVTVPATLVGLLLDGPFSVAGDLLLRLAHASIAVVLAFIAAVSGWPIAAVELPSLTVPMIAAASLAAVAILLPLGWPARKVAWVLLLAVVLHRPQRPPDNCFDVHLLDVGQGLAAVLQTRRHTVVYDTGGAFQSGSDMGQLVVAPFLKRQGVTRIDALVVSHGDLDHSGGAQTLAQEFEIGRLLAGERLSIAGSDQYACRAGQRWQWDGVQFLFVHPPALQNREGNDASCVLLVSSGDKRALLTGDIGRRVEAALISQAALPAVTVVSVPHHGSRTSSSARFVTTVAAKLAVVSSGHNNRWGFPKDDVMARWQNSGARVLTTATSGAVSQRLCGDAPLAKTLEQRLERRRYWHE